jgi:N-acyl-D-aspartate/D-glutamate deacylase
MYDLLIKNGILIDGSGAAARRADLAVVDGRIAAVGDLQEGPARETPVLSISTPTPT